MGDSSRLKKRGCYPTGEQKSQLIRLVREKPYLLSGKFTATFTARMSQTHWKNIAQELNSIPGAKKDWHQWRKTWQDLRCKTKAKQAASRRDATRTGGGPPRDSMTEDDVIILSTISEASISGHAAPESAADFVYDIQESSSSSSLHLWPQILWPQPSTNHPLPSTSHSQDHLQSQLLDSQLQPELPTTEPLPPTQSPSGQASVGQLSPRQSTQDFVQTSVPHTRRVSQAYQHTAVLIEQGERKLKIKEEHLKVYKDFVAFKKEYYMKKLEILESRNPTN